MATQKDFKYKKNTHKKKTRQGAGQGTKYGRVKGAIKPNRGQGGRRRSIKH